MQLPTASPGEWFGRDVLVPLFHVLGPGGGGEPGWGCGTGPSQHAASGQPSSLQALLPKLYASLGPHFNPHHQISLWILRTGEKQHCPGSLVAVGGGEGSARVRGAFMKI